jgi:hypothetical protein
MFATAFDAAMTRIGHRGFGDIDLAARVFADRAELRAGRRRPGRLALAGRRHRDRRGRCPRTRL